MYATANTSLGTFGSTQEYVMKSITEDYSFYVEILMTIFRMAFCVLHLISFH